MPTRRMRALRPQKVHFVCFLPALAPHLPCSSSERRRQMEEEKQMKLKNKETKRFPSLNFPPPFTSCAPLTNPHPLPLPCQSQVHHSFRQQPPPTGRFPNLTKENSSYCCCAVITRSAFHCPCINCGNSSAFPRTPQARFVLWRGGQRCCCISVNPVAPTLPSRSFITPQGGCSAQCPQKACRSRC